MTYGRLLICLHFPMATYHMTEACHVSKHQRGSGLQVPLAAWWIHVQDRPTSLPTDETSEDKYISLAARIFGSNSVPILATLFLLSYAKLLCTIITALSFTFLECPNGSRVAMWTTFSTLVHNMHHCFCYSIVSVGPPVLWRLQFPTGTCSTITSFHSLGWPWIFCSTSENLMSF